MGREIRIDRAGERLGETVRRLRAGFEIEGERDEVVEEELPKAEEGTFYTVAGGEIRQRAPRIKRAARRWDVAQTKKLFLRMYRLTGRPALARARIALTNKPLAKQTVWRWEQEDGAFKAEKQGIEEMWQILRSAEFRDFGYLSLAGIKECLEQRTDMRLVAEVAKWQLKSQGIGVEKVEISHSGPGGGSIPIRIHTVEIVGAAQAVGIIGEAEKAMADEGGSKPE